MKRTLSILKPDATTRNITGKINALIEENGFRIVAQKRMLITKTLAEQFYAVHAERPFYNDLVKSMCSAPVIVQVLEKENAIDDYRKLMGATNPAQAEEGTIRKNFAKNIEENSVHGSDSEENAKNEISFFFAESEIIS